MIASSERALKKGLSLPPDLSSLNSKVKTLSYTNRYGYSSERQTTDKWARLLSALKVLEVRTETLTKLARKSNRRYAEEAEITKEVPLYKGLKPSEPWGSSIDPQPTRTRPEYLTDQPLLRAAHESDPTDLIISFRKAKKLYEDVKNNEEKYGKLLRVRYMKYDRWIMHRGMLMYRGILRLVNGC